MAKCRLGILTFLFHHVLAITLDAAPSTTFGGQNSSTQTLSQAPSATPAPAVVINGTTFEPANLCGYVEYSSANSYTCGGDNTCLWNSKLGLVGCGNPTSVEFYTSCIPWRHMNECNSSCLTDPRVLRCSTPTPYCVTPIVGPHHNYSMFGCQSSRIYGRFKVHLTYAGQNTTGHLPRYLGSDDIITYGTIIPKNKTTTSTTPTPTPTVNTNPFVVQTVFVSVTGSSQPTGWGNGNWSGYGANCTECQRGRNRWQKAQIRTEIIAGTVIGGFMFLIAFGVFLWLFLAWRRAKKRKSIKEGEQKDVRLQNLGRDSVLTSEASGSTSGSSEVGSRRVSQRTTSRSREQVVRERGGDRDAEGTRSPVSPVSEVGSGYMSRGTSTVAMHDDIYDDDETVRGERPAVPLVIVSEAPGEEDMVGGTADELYDAEDVEPGSRLEVPVVQLSDVKEEPAAEEAGGSVGVEAAEPGGTDPQIEISDDNNGVQPLESEETKAEESGPCIS